MTAPFLDTTDKVVAAIKKVEVPLGSSGSGSTSNLTTHTAGVTSKYKGADHIENRKP